MSRYPQRAHMQPTRCTIEIVSGSFCDAESAPDMPFAICAPHALELYRRMHELVTDVRENHRAYPDIHAAVVEGVRERKNTRRHQVYYVRVGELIKIGVTKDLRQRLTHYPPGSQLLAVERGGEDLESRRHAQFRHLLADRKEWFHPGAELLAHVEKLAA